MAFDYKEYIERLCEDAIKLRAVANEQGIGDSTRFKIAWNAYLKCMNSLGNALSNEMLHLLKANGIDIDPEAKLKLINLPDNDK